jgi:hypothetical protein
VKKEESQDSSEAKENKEDENEIKSKRKTKAKASVKPEASSDGPTKKVSKGNYSFSSMSQYPLKIA